MTDPIRELKTRAEILQRRIAHRDTSAIARLRKLPDYRSHSNEQLVSAASAVVRRHCLGLIAIELGFAGWQHARHVLSGSRDVGDFGTLLYPRRCAGHLNLWYRSHADAVEGHHAAGGYLLPFRRQFMVVQRSFIDVLGCDPDAPEWQGLGFDWAKPIDAQARTRLYGDIIAQLPREQ